MADIHILSQTASKQRFPTKHHDEQTTPHRLEFTLTSNDLKNNLVTGVQLLAGVSGYIIEIISVTSFLKYNSATYTGGAGISYKYDVSGEYKFATSVTQIQATADQWETLGTSKEPKFQTGEGVEAKATSNFATGDSDLYLFIEYRYILEP